MVVVLEGVVVVEEEKGGVARVVAGKEGGVGKVEAREEFFLEVLTTMAQPSTTVKSKTAIVTIIILSHIKH